MEQAAIRRGANAASFFDEPPVDTAPPRIYLPFTTPCPGGGIGRRAGFRYQCSQDVEVRVLSWAPSRLYQWAAFGRPFAFASSGVDPTLAQGYFHSTLARNTPWPITCTATICLMA